MCTQICSNTTVKVVIAEAKAPKDLCAEIIKVWPTLKIRRQSLGELWQVMRVIRPQGKQIARNAHRYTVPWKSCKLKFPQRNLLNTI